MVMGLVVVDLQSLLALLNVTVPIHELHGRSYGKGFTWC